MRIPLASRKMKRKESDLDLDHVSDELSDFSLSSPARKIRRLNVVLPPIVEEGEEEQWLSGFNIHHRLTSKTQSLEEFPANGERAIVLFNPVLQSPMSSFSVNPDLIIDLKHHQGFRWNNQSRPIIVEIDDEESMDKGEDEGAHLAIVPWAPSQKPYHTEVQDSMEAEDSEAAAMEIEVNGLSTMEGRANECTNLAGGDEGLLQHLWQQQHCMIPQPPQNIPFTYHLV